MIVIFVFFLGYSRVVVEKDNLGNCLSAPLIKQSGCYNNLSVYRSTADLLVVVEPSLYISELAPLSNLAFSLYLESLTPVLCML